MEDPLPDHDAPQRADCRGSREGFIAATKRLPEALWKPLTWDQGWEMRDHAKMSVATNLEI
jgi:IS30 family transposase